MVMLVTRASDAAAERSKTPAAATAAAARLRFVGFDMD